ncbi:protein kinase domain protein [Penicillium antarcticum]|uniref:protein kinase domain protein n=1 Tax=Penicillium antarcticum TaxID=416450 RepID=UPI002394F5FC|nr:protein kinase domain protein [Penicillium antarcticum]KAJ5320452.1 protein kinase domain protein [Penicillium antarcticum]
MLRGIFNPMHNVHLSHDPEHKEFRKRAHLAEMITLVESPRKARIVIVQDLVPLEEREDSSRGRKEKDVFAPIRSMLQWDLSKRSTAKELAEDEWLKQYL